MEFLQIKIRYGRLVTKTDNSFRGLIIKEENGYFEGIAMDNVSSNDASFIFGTINGNEYNVYEIFGRNRIDYINFNNLNTENNKHGQVFMTKDQDKKLIGSCHISENLPPSNVNIKEFTRQLTFCKEKLTNYERKTYNSIIANELDNVGNKYFLIKKY